MGGTQSCGPSIAMLTARWCWLTALPDRLLASAKSILESLCANNPSSLSCWLDVVVGGAGGRGAGSSATHGIVEVDSL